MLQYVVAGLVIGGIYAVASAGVVVTYVSAGILNFAFGAMAWFVARHYFWLHSQHGWGIAPAALVSLGVVAPLLGMGLHVVLFRHVRLASTLVKVVVTIGVSVTLPPLGSLLFGRESVLRAPGLAPEPVGVHRLFGTAVTDDQLVVYATVAVIMAVGAVVLRWTSVGLAVRAMVDSEAMTSLSGVDPGRVALGVWALSSTLAGVAGVLAAPVIGLEAGDFTLLVAAAFAAVVAARLRSLVVAVATSFAMGITGALVQYWLPPSSSITAAVLPSIPFGAIVVVVAVHLVRSGRVDDGQGLGGHLDRAVRSAGSGVAATSRRPSGRPSVAAPLGRSRWDDVGPVAAFVAVAALPLLLAPFWGGYVAMGAAMATTFLATTLLTGEGGMIWLCQITFTGVGAVTTAQLATVHDWPLPLALVGAAALAAAMGLVIGAATLRLGGTYVALVTLTFALLMERLVFPRNDFSLFGIGVPIHRPGPLEGHRALAWAMLGVFVVLALFVTNLRRSTPGLALGAVRWSETGARTIGLSILQVRLIVAALGAFVAAIGGGLMATATGVALPDTYATLTGMVWLAVVVTFGVRSTTAALVAGMVMAYTPILVVNYNRWSWGDLPPIAFGLGAVLVARHPEGSIGLLGRRLRQLRAAALKGS